MMRYGLTIEIVTDAENEYHQFYFAAKRVTQLHHYLKILYSILWASNFILHMQILKHITVSFFHKMLHIVDFTQWYPSNSTPSLFQLLNFRFLEFVEIQQEFSE